METMKKLLKSGHTLIFTSIVLMFAIFVYFTNNFGYGWFAQNDNVNANGMWIGAVEPDSPIHDYEFYKVDDVTSQYVENKIFDTYTFAALGKGVTAEMDMGHYDKLERPKYHILLHISLKEGAETLYVDANINVGNYTLEANELYNKVKNEESLRLSSVMQFYTIPTTELTPEEAEEAGHADDKYRISWDNENKDFIFDSHYLKNMETDTFEMVKTSSTLSFSSVRQMFTIPVGDCNDVNDDGFADVFIFMTYSSERVNLLQGIVQDESNGATMDDMNMSFYSDFSLRVSGVFSDTIGKEEQ